MLCVKIGQTGFSYLVTRPAFVEQYNFMSCELYGQQPLGEGLFPQVAFRSGGVVSSSGWLLGWTRLLPK